LPVPSDEKSFGTSLDECCKKNFFRKPHCKERFIATIIITIDKIKRKGVYTYPNPAYQNPDFLK